jgi:serine/threonine-protein kinase
LILTALSSGPDPDMPEAALSTTLPPGTNVGPFRIVGVLGRGGMAAVYEAYDERLERTIALKVLPPEFLHGGTFARRFEKEARVIAKLEHPSIVPIYASGIDEGIPWMSMRLLAGGNMGTFLKNRRPDPRQAVRMLREVADALDYAHARGVVHRDIKPANILLDGAGGVCVGDFGLAQMLDGAPGLTRTGTLTGTPQYMAPEQVLGKPADHRSDIYSLGIVAYETFVGAIPFTAESPVAVLMKHVHEPLPTPTDELLPPALRHAIQKAAAKDPGDRWPSAGAFVAALETAVGVLHGSPAAHDVRGAGRQPERSRVVWAGAAGGVLLAAGGLAWFVAREPAPEPAPASLSAPERPSDVGPRADPAAVSQEVKVPAVVNPPVPVRLTPRATQQTPPSPQQSSVPPIEPAPPPVPPPANTEPPQTSLPQPSTRIVEVPAFADSDTSNARVAPPTTTPLADVITPPIRIRTVSPDYPTVARAAELEGDVLLQAIIGPDGKVSNVEVLQPVHPVLDEAARKAVLQYLYTPGRRNGIPESAKVRITVSFRLR